MYDSWKFWNKLRLPMTHRLLTVLCSTARKSCRPSSVWQEIRQTGGSPEACSNSLSRFCLWSWGNRSVLFNTRRTRPAGNTVETGVDQRGYCEYTDNFGTNSLLWLMAMRHRLMHDKVRHTCPRLLLEGQDTLQVVLEEFCSLWCIRGELSTVNHHQSQICLLQPDKESDPR